MPAIALYKPYATLMQVQAELRNEEPEDVDAIKNAINSASRMMDEFCNTDFWYHDHSGTGLRILPEWVQGDAIFLPWPIKTVTEVKDSLARYVYPEDVYTLMLGRIANLADGGVTGNGSVIRVRSPLSALAAAGGAYSEELSEAFWPQARGASPVLTLKGTFGYTLATPASTLVMPTDLPALVNRACVLTAAALSGLNHKRTVGAGGERTEIFTTSLPSEVKVLLRRWKIHLF